MNTLQENGTSIKVVTTSLSQQVSDAGFFAVAGPVAVAGESRV